MYGIITFTKNEPLNEDSGFIFDLSVFKGRDFDKLLEKYARRLVDLNNDDEAVSEEMAAEVAKKMGNRGPVPHKPSGPLDKNDPVTRFYKWLNGAVLQSMRIASHDIARSEKMTNS